MSNSVAFLVVAGLASIVGSLVLWLSHRVRERSRPDFQDQLRAIAPRGDVRTSQQTSGIVPLDPDEE